MAPSGYKDLSKEEFDAEKLRLETYSLTAPKKDENYLPVLLFNKSLCEGVCNYEMFNRLLKNHWDIEELKTGKAVEPGAADTPAPERGLEPRL